MFPAESSASWEVLEVVGLHIPGNREWVVGGVRYGWEFPVMVVVAWKSDLGAGALLVLAECP